ncbi:U3 snoRNP protein [Cytospora paraplurivora]|uniref:U3 snoRNP protein n=1 Tax=Cytospora paraplurivora TaxID=2898453 RepID=A0AAN9U3K8_9PEZI
MAGVADKARFHLERAVPQLREFEEKEIFSKEEIRTIVQKRTEYEHLVLGPGCKPHHFQSYIAWELSLEKLRSKRCIRKKIKHSTSHASNARVFNIYERAVFRHPGSLALWKEYLDYAARVKATKRWRKIMTRALRLHPLDAELWTRAGRRAATDGDMEGARGMFMRGCRFCNTTVDLWIEYARVEMEWLAKLERKKGGKKGLAGARAEEAVDEGDVLRFDEDDEEEDEFGDDDEILPDPLVEEQNKKAKEAKKVFTEEAVNKLAKSPALEGAIPRAIFDIARKQSFFGAPAGEAFFDVFASFTSVSAQATLIQHVLDVLVEGWPKHPATGGCLIRQPLVGVDVTTVEFPRALREVLARINTHIATTDNKPKLAAKTTAWIERMIKDDELDENIRTVLEHTKAKLESP